MTVELSKENRAEAIASMQQYFERNLPEPIGELPAGLLLDFFLTEVGPLLYNQGVRDAATRMTQRIEDLEGELNEDAFTYWVKQKSKRR
ncbi:Uncharacterized conserved protein, DUF2164 family [Bryocella elongata]|uniref:Uncharacterized conserved protein, DUF2164 family n=1 Tax=Bryocella elongata TaxID=863522 RepID=A0A1H5WF96_9BACT|nr:Uncharacterized conserved protein, DUF2164 family [Bryocella elongata]